LGDLGVQPDKDALKGDVAQAGVILRQAGEGEAVVVLDHRLAVAALDVGEGCGRDKPL